MADFRTSPIAVGEIQIEKQSNQLGENLTKNERDAQGFQSFDQDDIDDDPRLALYSVLSGLDQEIDLAETEYVQARDSLLYKMAALGKLYSEKKAALGHGNWLPWIESREKLDRVEATRCLRVFTEFPEILLNESRVTHLGKRDILSLIHAPETVKAEIKELIAKDTPVTKQQVAEIKNKAVDAKKPAKPVPVIEAINPPGQDSDFIDTAFEEVPSESALPNDPDEYPELDRLRDSLSDALDEVKQLDDRVKYFQKVFDDDDRLAAFAKEADKLIETIKGHESRINGLLHENAEMKKQLNYLDGKCKRQAKKLKELDHG